MLAQRVSNISGFLGMESSAFGYIYARQINQSWHLPFNCLKIRTWRDVARYEGPEALDREGPDALKRLPLLWPSCGTTPLWEGTTRRATDN